MNSWKTYILACGLVAATLCRAETQPGNGLTSTEYSAELARLLTSTQQLDSSGGATPAALQHLPHSWRVHTDNGDFEVSTAGLRDDVRAYEKEKNEANATAIRTRLESFRRDLAGFEETPRDVSNSRTELNSILGRPEFRDVRGPTVGPAQTMDGRAPNSHSASCSALSRFQPSANISSTL